MSAARPSKFGFPAWDERNWDELIPLLEPILALPHLKVGEVMTMPPYFSDTEDTRPYFVNLRILQSFLQNRFHPI